jgi:biopolymer transport protein ExbB/TolQ
MVVVMVMVVTMMMVTVIVIVMVMELLQWCSRSGAGWEKAHLTYVWWYTDSRQQTPDIIQQADSRQQTKGSRHQATDSRQQAADSRQQTADSRQQRAVSRSAMFPDLQLPEGAEKVPVLAIRAVPREGRAA